MAREHPVSRLLDCWPERHRRRREPGWDVWILDQPGLLSRGRAEREAVIDRCREAFFFALRHLGSPVFIGHGDDPRAEDVPGTWESVGRGQWRLPPDFDPRARETRHWLFSLGTWVVYEATEPVLGDWPDPWRATPDALLEWLASREMTFLVTSFPDDTEWLVAGST